MAGILDEAGGLLLDEAGGSIYDEAGAPPAPPSTGSWWGLHSVFEESRTEYDAYWSRPPLDCPVCAQPLVNAPSSKSGSGVELYCNYAGDHQYRWPQDREMQPLRMDSGSAGGGGW